MEPGIACHLAIMICQFKERNSAGFLCVFALKGFFPWSEVFRRACGAQSLRRAQQFVSWQRLRLMQRCSLIFRLTDGRKMLRHLWSHTVVAIANGEVLLLPDIIRERVLMCVVCGVSALKSTSPWHAWHKPHEAAGMVNTILRGSL